MRGSPYEHKHIAEKFHALLDEATEADGICNAKRLPHGSREKRGENVKGKTEPHATASGANTRIVRIFHWAERYRIYARRGQCSELVLRLFWRHRRMNHV